MQTLKIFIYDFLFIFITNHITNPQLLLTLDLLDLLTLPCLYLNPIYPHLTSQQILSPYFTQIYPQLYYFKQQPTTQQFPICCTVFLIAMVVLVVFRKQKANLGVMGAELGLVVIPVFVFRVASEIVNVGELGGGGFGVGVGVVVGALIAVGVVFLQYGKIAKFYDLIAGILLFCKINQYAMMAILAIKIIATYFTPCESPTKPIKLSLQSSLLISSFLLLFLSPIPLNYIILACFIGITFLSPIFTFLVHLQHKDITHVKPQQDDAYSLNKCYSYNQIQFFKAINRHIPECMDLECRCREVVKIGGLVQLKKWIPGYAKAVLRGGVRGDLGVLDARDYRRQIQYIRYCVEEGEELDFQGFILLHKLTPKNTIQQYQKYHYLKKYSLALQKQPPKSLKMNIVNPTEQTNPYTDLLTLQQKISKLLQKIKTFWQQLLLLKTTPNLSTSTNHNHQYVTLIEEISSQINHVTRLYQEIQMNYDQKEEAEFYWGIFGGLVVRDWGDGDVGGNGTGSGSGSGGNWGSLGLHQDHYVMVSCGARIENITTNVTHLLHKSRSQLVNHNYTTLMLPPYISSHQDYIRTFYTTYKISQDRNLTKPIALSPTTFKVVQMTHMLLPNFKWIQKSNGDDDGSGDGDGGSGGSGVNVVTLIGGNYKDGEDVGSFRKQVAFHLLVSRENLDILGYQPSIFLYFDQEQTIQNSSKLLRSNLRKLFPNINRQSLLNNPTNKILIAKQNKQFFNQTQPNLKKSPTIELTQNQPLNKKSLQKNLQISQVPSQKNKQLNLLLLSFQYLIQKEEKKVGRNSEYDVGGNVGVELGVAGLEKDGEEEEGKKKKEGKEPKGELRKLEIIQCVSILVIFGMLFTVYILFQIQYSQLQQFTGYYSKKSQFFTDLSYTQLYFQNFHSGQNRLQKLQQYWNYNQQYPDLVTIFHSISEVTFQQKFKEYVQIFENRLAFEELSDKIGELEGKFQGVLGLVGGIGWGLGVAILVNFVVSLTIFIKSQINSIKTLSTFLHFNSTQIQTNLSLLSHLLKILQIEQYNKSTQQQPQSQLSSKIITKNSKDSLVFQPHYEDISDRINQRKGWNFLEVKKEKLEKALKEFYRGGVGVRGKGGQEDSEGKNGNTIDKDTQSNQNNLQFSLFKRIYKNKHYLTPTFIGLILKISISLGTLLFITNLITSTTKCLQFKHQLFHEPITAINQLQNQYFGRITSKISLSEYEYNNSQLLKQLPSQFSQYRTYSHAIESTTNSLCTFIDRTTDQPLYQQCTNCPQDIFLSGIHILIEFIQQKFRKVRIGYLPRSYLQEENNLSLAIQVCLLIYSERNQVFQQEEKKFYQKYQSVKNLIRFVLIGVFVACLYLQLKEFDFAEKRKNKTKNLFKIVPAFMKNEFQTIK